MTTNLVGEQEASASSAAAATSHARRARWGGSGLEFIVPLLMGDHPLVLRTGSELLSRALGFRAPS